MKRNQYRYLPYDEYNTYAGNYRSDSDLISMGYVDLINKKLDEDINDSTFVYDLLGPPELYVSLINADGVYSQAPYTPNNCIVKIRMRLADSGTYGFDALNVTYGSSSRSFQYDLEANPPVLTSSFKTYSFPLIELTGGSYGTFARLTMTKGVGSYTGRVEISGVEVVLLPKFSNSLKKSLLMRVAGDLL